MAKKNSTQRKTVIIGMTERIDSLVTAYLLKKQNYNCIAVCVQFADEHDEGNEVRNQNYGQCIYNNLETIREICNELEMPFYAVKAQERYQEEVTDLVLAARIAGERIDPCLYCNRLKLRILFEKAEVLKASYVATGHYSKIYYDKKEDEYNLITANDFKNDQSYYISIINRDYLERYLLPLGEMLSSEVEKIGKSLGTSSLIKKTQCTKCFVSNNLLVEYIDKAVPKSLIRTGDIINVEGDKFVVDHEGIHLYTIGQSKVAGKGDAVIDPGLRVVRIDQYNSKVYISNKGLPFNFINLIKFYNISKIDKSRPISCFVQMQIGEEKIPCNVYFKPNNTAVLEFEEQLDIILGMGQFVVIFSKRAVGGKVLGCGIIKEFGIWEQLDRTAGKVQEEPDIFATEEEEESKTKTEFRF